MTDILAQTLPRTLAFGPGCALRCAEDLAARGARSVFVVASPPTRALGKPLYAAIRKSGASVTVWDDIAQEPSIDDFNRVLEAAQAARADAVVAIGGGSVMDLAKLVAAFADGTQDVWAAFGVGALAGRGLWLACLPTTAGTGSEVSPIAILLDEDDLLKKGVVSPHLVPDAAYVDPLFTLGVPAAVTAATGMDAFTHCIEAYANRFAHPIIDTYALEGVRLVARYLARAVEDGGDVEARTGMARASLYGGLCLGPVNTAAVHALAYPLGGEFHVPHGVSNAVLLPHVLAFNLPAAPERYADIAAAMGVSRNGSDLATARQGLERINDLSRRCGIPARLSDLGVPETAVGRMARSAMTVTRLLERNPCVVTERDAEAIYQNAFSPFS